MSFCIYPDALLRVMLGGGEAHAFLLRTTALSQQASDIHRTSDVALAAMSRLMTGALMLSALIKEKNGGITLTVDGGGPGGTMTCVAQGGQVKAVMQHPQIELPPRGAQPDVGALIGRDGLLTVVRDTGTGEPYIGQSALVSGEIGEDLAQYFALSEQTPSLVSLGSIAREGCVLSAGGALVQAMPGCSSEMLEALDIRSMLFSGISRDVCDAQLEDLAKEWFRGLDPVILGSEPLSYRCDCSRGKMERALTSLGAEELRAMIDEDGGASLQCQFCHTTHAFTADDLKKLLQEASHS